MVTVMPSIEVLIFYDYASYRFSFFLKILLILEREEGREKNIV